MGHDVKVDSLIDLLILVTPNYKYYLFKLMGYDNMRDQSGKDP